MNKSMNKAMVCAAVVAGIGTLGAMAATSMPKSTTCQTRRRMMGAVSNVTEEFADEFCVMAHKTGNAMIRTGRWINRLVP